MAPNPLPTTFPVFQPVSIIQLAHLVHKDQMHHSGENEEYRSEKAKSCSYFIKHYNLGGSYKIFVTTHLSTYLSPWIHPW